MPVPTQQELEERQASAQGRIEDIRKTYEDFVETWKETKEEELEQLKKVHGHINLSQIYDVLNQIDNTPDL